MWVNTTTGQTLTTALTAISVLALCATAQAWCDGAMGSISPTWKPARTIGTFTTKNAVATEIGRHESGVMHRIEMSFSTTCDGARCRTCAHTINGTAGYAPSVILIRDDAKRNRCVEQGVLAHELRHADVTRRAEQRFTRRLRKTLAWVRRPHRGIETHRDEKEIRAAQQRIHASIVEAIESAMHAAERVAKREDAAIDSERSTKAEWKRMRKRCGADAVDALCDERAGCNSRIDRRHRVRSRT